MPKIPVPTSQPDGALDPVSGLPIVGDGYFWRLEEPAPYSKYLQLQLRLSYTTRFLKRQKSWLIGDFPISADEEPSSHVILETAVYALNKDADILRHFNPIDSEPWAKYYGDYPPKSVK